MNDLVPFAADVAIVLVAIFLAVAIIAMVVRRRRGG
jgi:hypothetical protein